MRPVIGRRRFCTGLAALVRAATWGERSAGGRAGPRRAGARARMLRTAAPCWRRGSRRPRLTAGGEGGAVAVAAGARRVQGLRALLVAVVWLEALRRAAHRGASGTGGRRCRGEVCGSGQRQGQQGCVGGDPGEGNVGASCKGREGSQG
jgi:hypothetical protein